MQLSTLGSVVKTLLSPAVDRGMNDAHYTSPPDVEPPLLLRPKREFRERCQGWGLEYRSGVNMIKYVPAGLGVPGSLGRT